MNHQKIEVVDFGSNCRLGVYFLHLICSGFMFILVQYLEFIIIGKFVY